jgi:hypothetical protein
MKKIYLTLITCCLLVFSQAQLTLSGSSYTQDFDGIAAGLPTGWSVFSGATATALGTPAALTTTATAWNNTTGAFKNGASFDGSASGDNATTQSGRTDRSLTVRQTGSYGDPGASFNLLLSNTTSKTDFDLAFKIQSLDIASARSTTWLVQYGTGLTPASFTTVASIPATLTIGAATFTGTTVAVDFGSSLDSIAGPVWIRIVTLTASSGTGSRPTTGIDDFSLAWTNVSSSTPTITSSVSSVTGLNYNLGSGPSTSQSFVLSGSNLTGNITGTAITNFEFSLDNTTFNPFPGSITAFAGNVPPTTLYVRLIAGLAAGTYNDTLTLSSPGATAVEIIFSGAVIPPPPAIIINEFLADPSATLGDANGDGTVSTTNDEFIEFYNNEAVAVDMSGWTISDALAVQHTFPASTIVPAGGFITVFAGGTPTGISGVVMTAIPTGLSLNNASDVITLKDNFGTTVATHTYGAEGGNDQSVGRDPDITGAFVLHSTIVATGRLFSPGALNVTPPSSCSISAITAAAPSACNPLTNQYSVDITVTYANNPATGTLDVNGQSFAITSSPQTITLVNLPSNGAAVNVTAVFSDDGTCTLTENALFTAPASCTPPIPDCSELFFSEYVEGSGNNKCYEIYNPTNAAIDLATGSYAIRNYSNGSTTPTTTSLSGTVPAYGTFVVCNSGAAAAFTANADVVGGSLNGTTFYNGDDVLALFKGSNLIDIVGQIGFDPGTSWSNGGVQTAEQTLVRIVSVKAGDNEGADAFNPSLQWVSLGLDVATNLGQHDNDCAPFIWTGNTSTDWNTAGNWSRSAVPSAADEVIIPSSPLGAQFPLIDFDLLVSDLTVEANAFLNIAPTLGLIIDGTVSNAGTITLQSNAAGTAWLDDFTHSGSFVGNLTVETYVSSGSGLGQRYFGSPVANAPVQGLDGTYTGYPLGQLIPTATCDPTQLDPSSPYSNLFQWNENASFPTSCVQEGWFAISPSSNLTPGRAYSGWVQDASILSFTGAPNTGNTTYATSGTSGSGVANADGWHLLANPFPSPLKVSSVLNSGFTSPQIYDGGSGPYSGTFLPVLISGNNLAIAQGFVAEATGGSTFVAAQADRVADNAAWLKPSFTHMLSIDVMGPTYGDRTYIYFDNNATSAFDATADCKKRTSDFGRPTLYTNLNGEKMSLNGFGLNDLGQTVAMGLQAGASGTFTLNFDGLASFPPSSLIFLEDKLTGEWINVRNQNQYTFEVSQYDLEDRFEIHFTAPVSVSSTASSCDAADASILIDFGNYNINNTNLAWDVNIVGSNQTFNYFPHANNVLTLNNLDKGSYEINISYDNYSVFIPMEVAGAERVSADFTSVETIEVGEMLEVQNLSTGANTFTWTVDGQTYNNTNLQHIFNVEGVYEIELLASNNDCSASQIKTVEVASKTTATNELSSFENVNVYSQNATIFIDLSKMENSSSVEIFNLLGQSLYKAKHTNSLVKFETKNTASYYLVVIQNDSKQKTFKVLTK